MPEVNREAAVAEFERMADTADVDIDTTRLSEEEAEDVNETRDAFVSAIESGLLSVDEEGHAIINVSSGEPMKFRLPLGKDLMIMAGATDDKRMVAMERFVCALTSKNTVEIGRLSVKEWKLAMRVAGFLSAA